MTIAVKVPVLPESVADATLVTWHKSVGDAVQEGESLVDLETDKVMLEVPAPTDGVLTEVKIAEGETVVAEQELAVMTPGAGAKPVAPAEQTESTSAPAEAAAPAAAIDTSLTPAVRRLVAKHNLDASQISGTGKDGRLLKSDVEAFIAQQSAPAATAQPATQTAAPATAVPTGERAQERVPMTRLRARIAERLLESQQNAAILTTFNEVNMQPVMDLRAKYKDQFEKSHDVRLGFMSFFVKAAIAALKKFPDVNGYIDGQDVVYNGFYDIGLAVSSPRGLVVPVLRDADQLSMAAVEGGIREFAGRARDGKLTLEEMTGGTFTITNGGVFGSMLSTPIINPPQSAILGMHNIVKRAVVEEDQVVIRPMMYLALSYDHRLIDGATSVRFLVTIKEMLEDPARLLLDI